MDHIDIFNNSEIIIKRKSFSITTYSIILLVGLIFTFLWFCFNTYYPYFNLKASVIKDEQGYYLKTLILEDDITKINNTVLIIDNKEYKYKIKKISEEYLIDENYNKYYEVLITSKINKQLQINNNVIDINIKLPKTTYMKNLLKQIKKGMK